MKKFFYIGLAGLLLFEILNIYFIMPLPGSQRMNSVELAYFLYSGRWGLRALFIILALAGTASVVRSKKIWIPVLSLVITTAIIYLVNFEMSADRMFLPIKNVALKPKSENKLPGDRLVIGINNNGESKAYPIEFLAYHHQIRDTVGGKPVMVTYCSVCRTGRVYEPIVNGNYETFRLVGMDHFNAMFEDAGTGSWWRQSTGEAIAGPLKGNVLPEVESNQMTLNKWFELHPDGLVLQMDESFIATYDSTARFEKGKSTGNLTRTDSLSWKDKSWIVGIQVADSSKAYDWKYLQKQGIINDQIAQTAIVLVISSDGQSFAAFERPGNDVFKINQDTLFSDDTRYDFSGQDLANPSNKLKSIPAHQEFWHSWVTFQPNTQQYPVSASNRKQ